MINQVLSHPFLLPATYPIGLYLLFCRIAFHLFFDTDCIGNTPASTPLEYVNTCSFSRYPLLYSPAAILKASCPDLKFNCLVVRTSLSLDLSIS